MNIDYIHRELREALLDLLEHEARFSVIELIRVGCPADLGPDGHFTVCFALGGQELQKSLPVGLATAYLADEEAAVNGFYEWLEELAVECSIAG